MINNIYYKFLKLATMAPLAGCNIGSHAQEKAFYSRQIWPEDKGILIDDHGGGILHQKGIYYLFSEHEIDGEADATLRWLTYIVVRLKTCFKN